MSFLFDKLFQKQNPELASQMAKRGLVFDKRRHRWVKGTQPDAKNTYYYSPKEGKYYDRGRIGERTLLPSGFSLNDKSAAGWASTIEGAINAPVAKVEVSTLGGKENVSLIVRISLDKREDWGRFDLWQNSRWAEIHLSKDGKMEMPYHGLGKGNRMRKTKFKSPEDAIQKINAWINKVK